MTFTLIPHRGKFECNHNLYKFEVDIRGPDYYISDLPFKSHTFLTRVFQNKYCLLNPHKV